MRRKSSRDADAASIDAIASEAERLLADLSGVINEMTQLLKGTDDDHTT